MEKDKPSPVRLVAFSQAWFEPFVVTDSLPTVDANWIGQVFVSLNATVSGRAWLARGIEHLQQGGEPANSESRIRPPTRARSLASTAATSSE
jgi:hypothetical protein